MSERQAWVWWKQPSTGRREDCKHTSRARSQGSQNKRNNCKTSLSIFMLHALSIIFPFCSYQLVKFWGDSDCLKRYFHLCKAHLESWWWHPQQIGQWQQCEPSGSPSKGKSRSDGRGIHSQRPLLPYHSLFQQVACLEMALRQTCHVLPSFRLAHAALSALSRASERSPPAKKQSLLLSGAPIIEITEII